MFSFIDEDGKPSYPSIINDVYNYDISAINNNMTAITKTYDKNYFDVVNLLWYRIKDFSKDNYEQYFNFYLSSK